MKEITSCIILNYNHCDLTEKLVSRLETYEVIDHIIVVDSCSTDESKSRLPLLKSKKTDIILLEKNIGYAKGNNYGAKYAITEYNSTCIIIANPDVFFEEDYIRDILPLFHSDPNVYIASGIAKDIEGNISYCSYWKLPKYSQYLIMMFPFIYASIERRNIDKQNKEKRDLIITEAVSGALFIARREVFTTIGGFDENTFLYCEESILGGKIKEFGGYEVVSNYSYYYHNHAYHDETIEYRYKHYQILLSSRRYYLKRIQKIGGNTVEYF